MIYPRMVSLSLIPTTRALLWNRKIAGQPPYTVLTIHYNTQAFQNKKNLKPSKKNKEKDGSQKGARRL